LVIQVEVFGFDVV